MKITSISLMIAGLLFSCASSTEITGAWRNPKADLDVNSILVTAMTDKTDARMTVESNLAAYLNGEGIKAERSFDIMPPKFTEGAEPDKEAILNKIRGTDVDAILTVALLNKETNNRFVPGSYGYSPMTRFGYYGRLRGYYTAWYPTLYSPGYYTEDKTYFIETNLYDAKTEELLWSAQSETYNPSGLDAFSKEFAGLVVERMKHDNVIHTRQAKM